MPYCKLTSPPSSCHTIALTFIASMQPLSLPDFTFKSAQFPSLPFSFFQIPFLHSHSMAVTEAQICTDFYKCFKLGLIWMFSNWHSNWSWWISCARAAPVAAALNWLCQLRLTRFNFYHCYLFSKYLPLLPIARSRLGENALSLNFSAAKIDQSHHSIVFFLNINLPIGYFLFAFPNYPLFAILCDIFHRTHLLFFLQYKFMVCYLFVFNAKVISVFDLN